MRAMAAHTKSGEPSRPWTPREASAEEMAVLKEIRDMQDVIRGHMGSRSLRTISTKDMQEILVNNFGANWSVALATYQTAINAMDQGVSHP